MANPSKKKGTAAETKVLKYLKDELGYDVRRLPLSGNKDKGDLQLEAGGSSFTIEVKTGQQTANPSRTQLREWIEQAWNESYYAGTTSWVLVVVRYRRAIEDADVWYQIGDHTGHTYLDDFCLALEGK